MRTSWWMLALAIQTAFTAGIDLPKLRVAHSGPPYSKTKIPPIQMPEAQQYLHQYKNVVEGLKDTKDTKDNSQAGNNKRNQWWSSISQPWGNGFPSSVRSIPTYPAPQDGQIAVPSASCKKNHAASSVNLRQKPISRSSYRRGIGDMLLIIENVPTPSVCEKQSKSP